MLRKNLTLTIAVMTTLSLGIGATTAIYTVVYATLLAPLPFPHSNTAGMGRTGGAIFGTGEMR